MLSFLLLFISVTSAGAAEPASAQPVVVPKPVMSRSRQLEMRLMQEAADEQKKQNKPPLTLKSVAWVPAILCRGFQLRRRVSRPRLQNNHRLLFSFVSRRYLSIRPRSTTPPSPSLRARHRFRAKVAS